MRIAETLRTARALFTGGHTRQIAAALYEAVEAEWTIAASRLDCQMLNHPAARTLLDRPTRSGPADVAAQRVLANLVRGAQSILDEPPPHELLLDWAAEINTHRPSPLQRLAARLLFELVAERGRNRIWQQIRPDLDPPTEQEQ